MADTARATSSATDGPPAAYVHVGLPKTGTTYLQRWLWDHRAALAEHGLLVPGSYPAQQWHAAIALQGGTFAGHEVRAAADALEAVLAEVAAWPGPAIVSHEMFAAASADQVSELVGRLAPRDVHLVVTLRDLSRVIPATWQERAKNGTTEGWRSFVSGVQRGPGGGHHFWDLQDLPAVLDRWRSVLVPDRLHVVTVPPPPSAAAELLRRFASVVGIPDPLLDPAGGIPPGASNTSLGALQVRVLQSLNDMSRGELDWDDYHRLVKGIVVHDVLSRRPDQQPVALASTDRSWVERQTADAAAAVTDSGAVVVGDLDELTPRAFGGARTAAPEDIAADVALPEAGAVIVDLARMVQQLRGERAAAQRATDQHERRVHDLETAPAGEHLRRARRALLAAHPRLRRFAAMLQPRRQRN
ncbi:MAG: hypothetical protein ACRDQ1_08830 [Sciscionella sp.]